VIKSNVKEYMEKAGLSVRKGAAAMGLATDTLNRARQDETILGCSLETLQTIARACGCRVKDLFTEDN